MEFIQLTKKCQYCGDDVIHATRRGLEKAILENRACLSCRQRAKRGTLGVSKNKRKERAWNCPDCGVAIIYDTRAGYNYAKKANLKCNNCKGIHCKGCKVRMGGSTKTGYCLDCYQNIYLPLVRIADAYDSNSWRRNCPVCGNEITYTSYCGFLIGKTTNSPCYSCACPKRTTEEFIKLAKEIHGRTWYDYSKTIYTKSTNKVVITCNKHGDFRQTPQSHLVGYGCQKCNASHGERRIRVYLESKKLKYECEKKFPDCVNPKTGGKLRYDFYVPDYNLLIEYDGIQHYQFMTSDKGAWCKVMSSESLEDLQRRDKLKDQYAKDKGIELLRVNFIQKPHIEQILEKELRALPCRSKSHTLYSQICHGGGTF